MLTSLTTLGLLFTLLNGILLLLLPRQKAVIPLLLMVFFITLGQRIEVIGLNFYMLRIILMFGFIRMFLRKETMLFELNNIDKLIICWILYSILSYVILRQSTEALQYKLGFAYTVAGLYFLFRCLIVDYGDIDRTMKYISILIIVLSCIMSFEYMTRRNIFSIFGGVNEITQIRDGHLRCQGPFAHPILAGTVGAISVPFSVRLMLGGTSTRLLGIIAAVAGVFIVIFSGSSGPVLSLTFVIMGLLAWHVRAHMRIVRWCILIGLILLHAVMKAPIWFLIGRLSEIVGGGTGYHRSKLIDQAIRHFDEWWLLGSTDTSHWMPYVLRDGQADITNQYIAEGVDGGLIKMVLFVAIIVLCFRSLGEKLRESKNDSFLLQFSIWSMGAALFAHVGTFFSVSYFDQSVALFYLLWAMISRVKDLSGKSLERLEAH